jgi:hypothetical protein
MAVWTTVKLNAACTPAAEVGTIRLPKGTHPPGSKRLLLEAKDKEKLLKVSYRGDGGGGACLAAPDFEALGSPDEGRYRPIGLAGAVKRDRGLAVTAAIAILTFVLAIVAAIAAYSKATAATSDNPSGPSEATYWIAAGVLALAMLLAALKFYKDWNEI